MLQLLTIIGCIGLFLYSMKLMSEGLQKIMGDHLRSMVSLVTRNRFTGMLTGALVTALVQSSRATTVSMVSFVNAGMLSLKESMAVIMGANIGTTATTWIIALLFMGFGYHLDLWAIPLIAISLPLLNTKNRHSHHWGEFLMGFSLLFLTLTLFYRSMPEGSQFPAITGVMHDACSFGFLSMLMMLVAGLLLTICVQASSAAFTLVLFLTAMGWIPLDMAFAMIIGCNIGTCITPLMASLSANTMAKRAAVCHLLFNIVGALWALPLVAFGWKYVGNTPCGTWAAASLPIALALFHTLLNAINTSLLLGFTHWIAQGITALIKDDKKGDESFKLQIIGNGYVESGEIALLQVQKEIGRYASDTYLMFTYVRAMISENNSKEQHQTLFETVRLLEQKSDDAEEGIASYLNKISPKTLSVDSELLSRSYYKMIDELESVADSIYHIACTLNRKHEHRVRFTAEQQRSLNKMLILTDMSLKHLLKCVEHEDLPESAINKAYNIEDEINNYRTQMRNEMLELKAVEYEQATYFMDIINECERVGDFVINVLTAMAER